MKKNPNSTFHIPHSASGFTLVELIIVIAITALISTISIANFRKGEKQKQVVLGADVVINAIRNAQNYAQAGKATTNSNAACRTPQYYFVTLNYSSQITLSALNNNTSACGILPDTIQTYSLPVNTRIRAAGLTLNGTAATANLVIRFLPPFAKILAGRDGADPASFTAANIVVESTDASSSKTVIIDGVSGRIGE